jgi:uncharacterized membrane protein YphA (DoxX/SURF4 family)
MRKLWGFAAISFFTPAFASAHEVYVLNADEIHTAVTTAPFSEWQTILANSGQFLLWGFISALIVFCVFFISLSRMLEKWLKPLFAKLPPYAPLVSRVAVGAALIAGAYHNALFGPELPLAEFGSAALLVRAALFLCGAAIICGVLERAAAALLLMFFAFEVSLHHEYMLTYAGYVGEAVVVFILASASLVRLKPYAFTFLRIAFGITLLYSAFYAKILHNQLALAVATEPLAGHAHSLAYYFGFEPHFLVLGAAIIELVLATFFILGLEIRFASVFVLFWLSLSLFYFGESVWPHLVLIGLPIAFFMYGRDRYSLEGYFRKLAGRDRAVKN